MMIAPPKQPILRQLSLPAVENYLQSQGWTKAEGTNPNIRLYHGPKDIHGNPLVVALPARSTLIDAKRRLTDVVRTVATLEAKSLQQMTQKIMAAQRPAVRSLTGKPRRLSRSQGKRIDTVPKTSA